MRVNVKAAFAYTLDGQRHEYAVGECEMPDDLAQIATGAGWAVLAEAAPSKAAPVTKARKAAPENK